MEGRSPGTNWKFLLACLYKPVSIRDKLRIKRPIKLSKIVSTYLTQEAWELIMDAIQKQDSLILASPSTLGATSTALEPIESSFLNKKVAVSRCISQFHDKMPLPEVRSISVTERRLKKSKSKAHFFYSNDFYEIPMEEQKTYSGYTLLLDTLASSPCNPKKNTSAAILVGESSLISSLPELKRNVEVVLIVDYDHLLLHLQLRRIELIKQCGSLADEQSFVQKSHQYIFELLNMKLPEYKNEEDRLRESYGANKKALLNYFPFSSEDRLKEVVVAANNLTFIPVYCNIFAQSDIQVLKDILTENNMTVEVANFSNSMEYSGEFYSTNRFSYSHGIPTPYLHIKELPYSITVKCCCTALLVDPNKTLILNHNEIWDALSDLGVEYVKFHVDETSWIDSFKSILESYLFGVDKSINNVYMKLLLASISEKDLPILESYSQCCFLQIERSFFIK